MLDLKKKSKAHKQYQKDNILGGIGLLLFGSLTLYSGYKLPEKIIESQYNDDIDRATQQVIKGVDATPNLDTRIMQIVQKYKPDIDNLHSDLQKEGITEVGYLGIKNKFDDTIQKISWEMDSQKTNVNLWAYLFGASIALTGISGLQIGKKGWERGQIEKDIETIQDYIKERENEPAQLEHLRQLYKSFSTMDHHDYRILAQRLPEFQDVHYHGRRNILNHDHHARLNIITFQEYLDEEIRIQKDSQPSVQEP